MKKKPRRHWYRIYVGECPVCGRDKGYRERVYGRKPKSLFRRIVQISDGSAYDHCLER